VHAHVHVHVTCATSKRVLLTSCRHLQLSSLRNYSTTEGELLLLHLPLYSYCTTMLCQVYVEGEFLLPHILPLPTTILTTILLHWQVYVEGEFLGGCDVMIEMYQSGELAQILTLTP